MPYCLTEFEAKNKKNIKMLAAPPQLNFSLLSYVIYIL